MLGRNHLRKGVWLGRVFFVTAPAEAGNVGQLRNMRGWVVSVLRQGPVTGFACYVSVLASGARLGFAIMADNAGVLPSVGNLPLANQVKRAGTIVAVLAESLGDDLAAHHQKYA
jgi:hypothetical protein